MITLSELSEYLGGTLKGDGAFAVTGIAELKDAGETDLTFYANKKLMDVAKKSPAKASITLKESSFFEHEIIVKDFKKALALILRLFIDRGWLFSADVPSGGVKEGAQIHPTAQIADSASIEADTIIGEGAKIGPNVSIGKGCVIGKHCQIYPNVVLYDSCRLGDNVVIHSGSVIGVDGFGYYQDEGAWHAIPHVGYVELGDGVEVGSCTTIDRGCLGGTILQRGVKLDNMCHIAHNVVLGEGGIFAGSFTIGGSSVVGKSVIAGGDVTISDHVTVGDNALLLGRSGVTKDLPAGGVFSGFPARPHKEALKSEAKLRRLINS